MPKPATKTSDLKIERASFVQLANLSSLKEINSLSETDVIELCQQFPKAAGQLIIDLNTALGLAEAELQKAKP
jgi:hypothetical protein